jgi:exonuclease SbcC
MSIKILHLADIHADREHMDKVLSSLEVAEETAREHGVSLIAIAGDTFDGPIQNTAGARFPEFVERIRCLADIAPIAMIYGTPSHDTEGSLDVFETLKAKHSVVILRPGEPIFLNAQERELYITDEGDLMILGIPEPQKKWLLAGGANTDAESVNSALRQLVLGLAAKRKEHPEIPCVVLYHGDVAGAKTATGYEAGTGIAFSRDDLAMIGANYYALGHIHEPQQIPGLPAFYSGSAYPLDWGETHKAGCYLVEIKEDEKHPLSFDAHIIRIGFPHSQNIHIIAERDEKFDITATTGKIAWIELRLPRGPEAEDYREAVEIELKRYALPGSKVTISYLPTETVRAAEITIGKTLAEKVMVWGKASEVVIPAEIVKKADQVELEVRRDRPADDGTHIRINRLRLRGAKGIWKNQRKDEIDLDLDAYGSGIIAVTGGNGMGKTTILENLQPFTQMLTRGDKLKDHFRLRDSARDLYFTDERTGTRYWSSIRINAATASGGAEYYLFADCANIGEEWKPLPGINGRKEPYEAAIAHLFGSLELYLRTAFVTQRPTKDFPDLSEASEGARKSIFRELAGLDHFEAYRMRAKLYADDAEAHSKEFSAEAHTLESTIAEKPKLIDSLQANGLRLMSIKDEIAVCLESGRTLRTEYEHADAAAREQAEKRRQLDELETEQARLERENDVRSHIIDGTRGQADYLKSLRERLAEIDAATTEFGVLNAESQVHVEGQKQVQAEYQKSYESAAALERDKNSRLKHAREEQTRVDREITTRQTRAAGIHVPEGTGDTCPTCNRIHDDSSRAFLDRERNIAIGKRKSLEDEIETFRVNLDGMKSFAASIESEVIKYPSKPEEKDFPGTHRLKELQLITQNRPSTLTKIREVESGMQKAQEARTLYDETNKRLVDLAERITAVNCQIVETDLQAVANQVKARLEAARDQYPRLTADEAALKAQTQATEDRLSKIEETEKKIQDVREEAAKATAEAAEWRLLEKACGPDGIQALELDALSPSIAAVANDLLAGAYGTRFAVEFRTTRIGGQGSKRKQIEDFLIYILDQETGEEQEIATLSGGESVWIKRALYDAFAIIRARNTGITFLTAFQDETDGALDPEARTRYLRMLEAAHAQSGRHQTLLITHSRELQEMIAQTIDVTTLTARASEEKAT